MIIAILLSTYNGENYLRELFESLINQTNSNWKVFIRDDSSSDGTIDIVNQFCTIYSSTFFHLKDNEGNIGAKKSFSKLLECTSADYYMFCDQDDIWLPEKIELTLSKLITVEKTNPDIPVLVHSDLKVVDDNLNVLHESFLRSSKLNPKLLKSFSFLCVNNCVTGCTVMFNQLAKNRIEPIPEEAIMHDWWAALVVSKYGIIEYLNCTTILYRQHTNNVVGAREIGINYYFKRLKTLKITIDQNARVFIMGKRLTNNSSFSFIVKKIYILLYKNFLHKF